MREYFAVDDVARKVANCPQCGLIIEKEEAGCNHMICAKCNYHFCWICGMEYKVDHFDASNVFGCQGLQESAPQNRNRMIFLSIMHLFLIPFTLLFYPVYVMTQAYHNPYNVSRDYRWLCSFRRLSSEADNCCVGILFYIMFLPLIVTVGLALGVLYCACLCVPAVIFKLYKICQMTCCWRCNCCLDRHKK